MGLAVSLLAYASHPHPPASSLSMSPQPPEETRVPEWPVSFHLRSCTQSARCPRNHVPAALPRCTFWASFSFLLSAHWLMSILYVPRPGLSGTDQLLRINPQRPRGLSPLPWLSKVLGLLKGHQSSFHVGETVRRKACLQAHVTKCHSTPPVLLLN